jgi:hypothetical protein
MKRPSFQFYAGDWQANSNLRRCSLHEKGAWIDMLCLAHDQSEYGVLRWPLSEIARAVAAPLGVLRALVDKGVLKGHDKHLDEALVYVPRSGRKDGEPVILLPAQPGPIWFSSRMVRDEYIRASRGESSRFSADEDAAPKATPNPAPKAAPKPPFGDGSSSSSSSSSSIPPGPQRGKTMGVDELVALGVTAQHASDWLAARKAKRLPLTPTAWEMFYAAAAKQGLSPAAAVEHCAARGWAGFHADATQGAPAAAWGDAE